MRSWILCLLCIILLIGSGAANLVQNKQSAAVAYNNMGVALFSLGKINESIQAYDNATKIDPQYADAWTNKGIALSSLRRYNESIQAFDKAIELNPQPSETTGQPSITIYITNPKNGDKVSTPAKINGSFLGAVPQDHYIWILVSPRTAPGLWYPQGENHLSLMNNKIWNWQVILGGDADKNSDFDIAAVLVDNETDQQFRDWLDRGKISKTFPAWRLPDTAKILDKVTVTRI